MEPSAFIPWEKYPELAPDRLAILASVLCAAREGAVRRHEPKEGDSPWGLGCVSYERTFFALKEASKQYDWLTVTQDPAKPLRFAFAIGHVPFRIYQGDPGQPPSKYLSTTYVELHERQLALNFGIAVPADGILRVAIETDATGRVSEISIVEIDDARRITGVYQIELDLPGEALGPVPMQTPPVDLAPPSIEPALKPEERKKPKAQNDSGR